MKFIHLLQQFKARAQGDTMNRTSRSLPASHGPFHYRSVSAYGVAGTLALALALASANGCGSGDSEAEATTSPAGPGVTSGDPAGGTTAGTGGSGAGGGSTGEGGSGAAGGGGAGGDGGSPIIDYCTACGDPATVGAIVNDAVSETSGLVASAIHQDVFYVHNDSGGDPAFFAIGADGQDLGTFDVGGAVVVDWEDIARGPCPAGSCLYLADIGDNAEQRSIYILYRVPEPDAVGQGGTVDADAFSFVYPDGSHNAETLLVHPDTGVVTIVTKVSAGNSSVYEIELPSSPGAVLTATKTGEIAPPEGIVRFTGGDVHPASQGVLLRTYTNVFFYAALPGQSVAQALAGAPCVVPAAGEAQGEAIAWTRSGEGYLTVSEGANPDLHAVQCVP